MINMLAKFLNIDQRWSLVIIIDNILINWRIGRLFLQKFPKTQINIDTVGD